jgi:sugar/nucleoside kinase (ribokinase family)
MAATSSRLPGKTSCTARGALYGLAIGDALGMPTQMLSRADVIVRAGQDGCVLALRTTGPGTDAALSLSRIPAPAVTAVDTTGAGDAHSGVFLAALAAGLTATDAARRANAAAALTRSGAAVSPTRAELDQFLARPQAAPHHRGWLPSYDHGKYPR